MKFDISRRVFIRGAGLAAVGVGFGPSSLLVRAAQAATAADTVLVMVFLRGGADGLNLCAPYGESDYYSQRSSIALPRPGAGTGALVDLDGFFGLHPSLNPLKSLYSAGKLGFLHAVGNPALSRSHFDAQDFMETGTPGVKGTPGGWLGRATTRVPGSDVTQAVAFSSQLPRTLLGGDPVLVARDLASFDLHARTWRAEAEQQLRAMYAGKPTPIGETGRITFEAVSRLLATPEISAAPSNGAQYPDGTVGLGMKQSAQLIKSNLGTRCIFVNVQGGFDTHANQLTANTNDYTSLGSALAAFDQDLGAAMDRVLVMVTTEFGRAAYENGSQGTDHGTAHAMIYLGGHVRGGRVHGRWPGLSRTQLFEERDLAVTTDFRDAFAEAARVQLGVADVGLLFPGYAGGAGPGVVA